MSGTLSQNDCAGLKWQTEEFVFYLRGSREPVKASEQESDMVMAAFRKIMLEAMITLQT